MAFSLLFHVSISPLRATLGQFLKPRASTFEIKKPLVRFIGIRAAFLFPTLPNAIRAADASAW
jgi:hypothetical protein